MVNFLNKINQKRWFLFHAYTVLFSLMSVIIFSYFYLSGKTFISTVDGVSQYYKTLIYYHRYLLDILSNLFRNHQLIVPQWEFHLGEGADILAAMYHTIGDPIAAFVMFVPEEYVYLFYDLTIVLRIYLSGLCFLVLCQYLKKGNLFGRLAGAMVYDFCYWMLLSQSNDIYFLNPTICFPLVILGVEKVLKERRPLILVLAVFYSAICNFYFFFMIVILTILYVLIRLIFIHGMDFKGIFSDILYIGVYAILGTALGAVTALPVGYALLSNNRLSVDYGVHLLYPILYYERILNIFLSKDDPYWLCMGFASPCLISFVLSLRQFKKDKFAFVLNLLTTVMICIPFCGKVLNGFSYVSNRWCFAIALVVAYTLTVKWDELKENRLSQLIMIFMAFAWAFAFPMSREVRIFIPICICLFFFIIANIDMDLSISGFDLRQFVLLGLVLLSILYNADYVYSYRGRQRTNLVLSRKEAEEIHISSEAYAMKANVNDEGFYRYSGSDLTNNIAILNETYTTSYYFSIANPNVSDYRNKLGIDEYLNYYYYEYDARGALHTLANVRYYITKEDYEGIIPYGFSYDRSFDGYHLYRNENDLPFGYTYDKSISYEKWDRLNSIEKQEAMLKAVVTEGGKDDVVLLSKVIDHTTVPDEHVEVKDKTFKINKDKSSVTLHFNGLPESEYYLVMNGIRFDDGVNYYQDKLTDTQLDIFAGDQHKIAEYHTSDYQFYNGKDSYSVFLGYYEEPISEIVVEFYRTGTYEFEEFEVICAQMSEYEKDIEKLGRDVIDEVSFSVNQINGIIDLDHDSYLVLSVPYSEGWKAYVDGSEFELLKANECYMGLKLSSGKHEIQLKYHTPLLKAGTLISIAACAVLVFDLVWRKKKEK